jgi:hypothetical protein
MKKKDMERIEQIRKDYLAACERATGCPFHGSINYENGWFVLRQPPWPTRFRRCEIENMISRLNGRIPAAHLGDTDQAS